MLSGILADCVNAQNVTFFVTDRRKMSKCYYDILRHLNILRANNLTFKYTHMPQFGLTHETAQRLEIRID